MASRMTASDEAAATTTSAKVHYPNLKDQLDYSAADLGILRKMVHISKRLSLLIIANVTF